MLSHITSHTDQDPHHSHTSLVVTITLAPLLTQCSQGASRNFCFLYHDELAHMTFRIYQDPLTSAIDQ